MWYFVKSKFEKGDMVRCIDKKHSYYGYIGNVVTVSTSERYVVQIIESLAKGFSRTYRAFYLSQLEAV